ncbi:MAG: hypothetical protein Q4F70_06220, partial [Clostridia bacterium]|nr:hypothetical protein [Clostridia bacterium]
ASLKGFFWIRGCGEVNNLAARTAFAMMPTIPGQVDMHYAPLIVTGMVRKYCIKVAKAAMGQTTEPHFDAYSDRLYTIPEYQEKHITEDWVEAPLPKPTKADRIQAIKDVRFFANFMF